MIDISAKDISVRTAKVKGTIALGENAFEIIKQGTCKKGDIFTTAKIFVGYVYSSSHKLR